MGDALGCRHTPSRRFTNLVNMQFAPTAAAIEDPFYLDVPIPPGSFVDMENLLPCPAITHGWMNMWRSSALSSPPCLLPAFWLADNHGYTLGERLS